MRSLVRLLLLATLWLVPLQAGAGIVAVSGTVTEITPAFGADFTEGGAFETGAGTNTIWAFEEADDQAVTAFPLDLQPGDLASNWSPGDPSSPTTVTTDVDVHYLHFDTQDGSNVSRSGFVEFDAPVLGVLVETASLDATDAVVSPSFTFDPARSLGGTDSLRLEAGDRRLVFSFLNGVGVDSVRVVTGDAAASSSFTEITLVGGESFVEGGAFEGIGGVNTGFWFAEQAEVDVTNLEVDLDTAALQAGWTQGQATSPTPITARVDSYYVFFDSVDDSQNTFLSGTITFPGPVLGVIFSNGRLVASDPVLAEPGVSFAATRQLGTPGDGLELDTTGRVLSITFVNADFTDDVRILVASASSVPVGSPLAWVPMVLGMLGVGFAALRRR